MTERIALFNQLLKLNEELKECDLPLSPVQNCLMAHIAALMEGTAESFHHDCAYFKDLVAVYKGEVDIIEGPTTFVPVFKTRTMMRLLDRQMRQILENKILA